MKITLHHLRTLPVEGHKAGYCSRGTRAFFERNQLDWDKAKRDGIDEEEVLATGDAQAAAVVAWAHKLESEQNG